jgi:membrane fusion protein (multidrug efflux system)
MSETETAVEGDGARPSRMSLGRVFLAIALLLVGVGVLLRATAPEPEPIASDPDAGIPVEALTIVSVPLEYRVEVSGIVEARRRVELFAEETGHVLEIGAEALDRVTVGQLLVHIDPLSAEVEVARAAAVLAQAESELSLARANLERLQTLRSSRVSSESDLDDARNAERVAQATQRAATASLRNAEDRLAKRRLLAPFDGVLREFDVEADEYVIPGQRVGELLEVSLVRVTVGLRDREVVAIEAGWPAQVRVESLERVFPGKVTRVAAAADAETRKFPVQVQIDNASGQLLPGMVASVGLDLGGRRPALLVSRDTVLDEFGLSFVYVIQPAPEGNHVAERRRVTARGVPFRPGQLELVEGIAAGERIATTSLRQLRDGVRVAPRRRPGIHRETSP